jgi:hypothetical protein
MAQQPEARGETGFPQAWKFDEDGLRIEGTYLRLDEGPTEYGRRAIVVLDVEGVERALWLSAEVLRRRFADELERRQEQDFTVGELVVVERGEEKRESEAGRGYWPFTVQFPDAPQRTAASLLGADVTHEQGEKGGVRDDDDIPF